MPDRPPRQLEPRPDPGGADLGTQIDLGWAEPQPEPPPPDDSGLILGAAIEADASVAPG